MWEKDGRKMVFGKINWEKILINLKFVKKTAQFIKSLRLINKFKFATIAYHSTCLRQLTKLLRLIKQGSQLQHWYGNYLKCTLLDVEQQNSNRAYISLYKIIEWL